MGCDGVSSGKGPFSAIRDATQLNATVDAGGHVKLPSAIAPDRWAFWKLAPKRTSLDRATGPLTLPRRMADIPT
jgi:hypothetical protein